MQEGVRAHTRVKFIGYNYSSGHNRVKKIAGGWRRGQIMNPMCAMLLGMDAILFSEILRSTKEHNLIGYSIKSPEKSWMEMMAEKEIWERELILFDYDNTVLLGKGSDEDI